VADTKTAQANIQAQRATLADTEQNVLLQAVNAYADLVRDVGIVDVRRNNVKVLIQQLDATRERFRVGELTITDVSQAEARLEQAKADLVQAEAQVRVDQAAFQRAIGVPAGNLGDLPLIGALPATAAEPVLDVLEYLGWLHKPVSIRFSTASHWGLRRVKIEASLRRWRRFSVRYAKERIWVERWLHMIDRALTKQPQAASAVIATADMIQGYGSVYRHGLADWHAIIDGLVKPTFDGVLPLTDLTAAIAQARASIMPDPRQIALKRKIAEIRARVLP